jgi:hypothetical protein
MSPFATMRSGGPCGRRARAIVARVLLVALLLPGVFSLTSPDPQWLLGVEREHAPHEHAGTTGHDHSAIPGSAGHPADHDCAPCQVLKYLAVGLARPPLALPGDEPAPFPRALRASAQRTGHLASLPPSRAPPGAA